MSLHVEQRPSISVSEQFMADMVPMIRRQFCPKWDDKAWNSHLWIVQRAVTYPAAWLNKRGLFVSAERYRELFLELLQDIKRNAREEMKFPPGYLLHCIQQHMRFNADRYNNEGKDARSIAERTLATAQARSGRDPGELVKTLAEASRLIQKPGRRRRVTAPQEPTLFNL
jgi:hypothetical protein